jgi:hypothetical protein
MINMQSKLVSISKKVLEDSDREHNSVKSASITEFPDNSFVLVTQRTSADTRLHTLWRGPMKVIDHKQGEYIAPSQAGKANPSKVQNLNF